MSFCVTTVAVSNIPAWFSFLIHMTEIYNAEADAWKSADVSARWSRVLGTNTWTTFSAAASPSWLKTAYLSCRYMYTPINFLYTSPCSNQPHDLWLTCTDAVHLDPRRTVRGIQAELGLHQRVHLPWGLPPIVGPDHVCHVHSVKALVSVVPKLFVDRYNLCWLI